jgi:hypothetical protein
MNHVAEEQHLEAPGLDLQDPGIWRFARRIYWSRFSRRVLGVGLDPEDTWQDVALGIVRKQTTASRWDPTRSSASRYLFLVIGSLVSHAVESHLARMKHVRPWSPSQDDEGFEDPALQAAEAPEEFSARDLADMAEEAGVPVEVLLAVAEGKTAREAAQQAGLVGMEVEAVVQRVAALGRRGREARREAGSVLDLFG